LDRRAGEADDQRCEDQRRPVADAEGGQQQVTGEGADHVLRAVGEVDDLQHAEDDRQPQTEQRIEGAVDQADQQLAEERLDGYVEDRRHQTPRASLSRLMRPGSSAAAKLSVILPWSTT